MVKQVGLLTAGCQPWNNDVCAASRDRFAYCSTLAIYIYQRDLKFNEFRLHAIMSEHKKTITSISWNPRNPDQFVSSSADNRVIVWDVSKQKVIGNVENTRGIPCSVGWCSHDQDSVAYISPRGPLYIWKYLVNDKSSLSTIKDTQNFVSDVCQYRWHPKRAGKMAFGHVDGSLSILTLGQKGYKHVLRPETMESSEDEDPVTALEWDPLSVDYILISNTYYGIRLLDTEALSVVMSFELPSAAARVHTLSWISTAPGMFVTGDTHSGILRIWNVSKPTPIENLKLKKTGFHCLYVISDTSNPRTSNGESGLTARGHVSSTSVVQTPSLTTLSRFSLPQAQVVCTFLDGGIGLYDLGGRKWRFLRDQGHVETIFDCQFKPDNGDLLATASFDGTIKVWDINTLNAVHTSTGNEGVIYCISWSPGDLNCIVASTSKQGIFIWDIGKGKVVKRFMEHAKSSSVFSVAWSQKDSRRILSCGADGYCIVRLVDGTLVQKYKHPCAVFGGDWSPHNKDMLATGCEDKNVRVYYLATSTDQPLKVFSGHRAKVFHVRWSPLREGLLCSGSDDGSIRVWDYTQEACVNVLLGHTAPVRGLLWNTEVPYLLISGSWDYSIRIWDTRDGACVDTMLDHGADVYGLASHPSRPFVLASSSRDSTVRIWSMVSLVQPIEINIMAQRPWEEIIGPPDHAISPGTAPLLTGKVSKELRQQIDKLQGNVQARTLRFFSKFFTQPTGTNNLWELVAVVMGMDDSLLSSNYSKGIMHVDHLTRYMASEAQMLEMIKMSKFGGGIGTPTKEERLREAAHIHIKLGNIQRYCELMVELGEWEKALAVSPGVSVDYWRTLSQRYAQFLIHQDSDDAIPFCMADGNGEQLVQFLTTRGQLKDAVLTAQVACEGTLDRPAYTLTQKHHSTECNGVDMTSSENQQLLYRACEALADWYFRTGSPILAACCHLASNDTQKALAKLIRGNELELAVSVGQVLGNTDSLTHLALEYLARRCEDLGRWELAVDLLKMLPDSEILLARLCARCAASMDEINFLHAKAGFPNMDECFAEAERIKSQTDVFDCVKFYLLSTMPEMGLQLGLQHVKAIMSGSSWQVDEVFPLLHMMAAIKSEKLQHSKCDRMRTELLALCAYSGALLALRRQYDVIVPALFSFTRKLMSREESDIPLTEEMVEKEYKVWQSLSNSHKDSGGIEQTVQLREDSRLVYDQLVAKAGHESSPVGFGPDCVASSHLPSHSDIHVSYLTGHRIQGHAFFLEDGKSAISINEALMWAKVNPFSPLGSGLRINPF